MLLRKLLNRKSTAILLGSVLSATIASAASPQSQALSQEPKPPESSKSITLVLKGEQRPLLHLAFPHIKGQDALSGEAAAAGATLEATLRSDLNYSGIFEIQGPDQLSVLQLTSDPKHDDEQYRSLGNEILLSADLAQEGDKLVLTGRVIDLKSGKVIVGKRYRGGLDLARRIAHSFSDEIVLYFTGRRGIALTSIAFSSDRDGYKELYLMDYDGKNQRQITAHKSISLAPAWAPSGTQIAYVSFFGGAPGIYRVDLTTGSKEPLVTNGPLNTSPSYSPSGREIVFARSIGGNTEIFVADSNGKNLRRLTHSFGIDTNPAWSPTGREIAFTSSRSGNPNIYTMDAEGTNLRRVSFSGDYNDGASWSPDGTHIAYASRQHGVFQIAVTDLVTLETHFVTSGRGSHESPSFSPDGRRITFSQQTNRGVQIFTVGLDGHGLRQLTSNGNNSGPSWSPYPPSGQ